MSADNPTNNVMPMRVAIVGRQSAKVHQILVTVIATCACGASEPIILPNVAAVAKCPKCGDEYFLKRLQAESVAPGEGGLNVDLGRLSRVPEPRMD